MPATIIDEYQIFPRIMIMVVTVLTNQVVHWYIIFLPDFENITEAAGLVIIRMVPLEYGCPRRCRSTEVQMERQNEMILFFILLVYVDGLAHDTGGTPALRDITRCKYFATEIETTGQTLAAQSLYK